MLLEPHLSPWGRAAGGRLSAIGGASETPPPGAAPRPSGAGLGDFAKSRCPAPLPDWRPLFAAQLQETTPRRGCQQVRLREGFAVGPGRVLALRWVSVSPSGEWGGKEGSADGPGSTGTVLLSISPTWKYHANGKETDRRSGNGREPWTGDQIPVQTPPAAGFRCQHLPASVSTSAHWGRWLFLTVSG